MKETIIHTIDGRKAIQTIEKEEEEFYDFDKEPCRYSFDDLFTRVDYNNGYKYLTSQDYFMLMGFY